MFKYNVLKKIKQLQEVFYVCINLLLDFILEITKNENASEANERQYDDFGNTNCRLAIILYSQVISHLEVPLLRQLQMAFDIAYTCV